MLSAALNNGERVIAWEADRKQAPFLCPVCGGVLTLKQGSVRIHHFAHTMDTDCPYRGGETQEHLRAKKAIYEALKRNSRVSKLELERNLNTVRPDISCYVDQTPIAIEVQRSDLEIETVKRRVAEYTLKKVALMWVLISPPSVIPTETRKWTRDDCLRLKDWQRYLKVLYYNRLYYFAGNDRVSSFSFYPWTVERGFGWSDQGDGYWDHDDYGIVKLKNTWMAFHEGDFSIVDQGEVCNRKAWKDYQAARLWKIAD